MSEALGDPHSIIVTNISPLLELVHLKELFECCGPISKSSIQKDAEGKPSSCRLTFKDPAHAKAAIFLSGTPLGDRSLQVSADMPQNNNSLPAAAVTNVANNLVLPITLPGTGLNTNTATVTIPGMNSTLNTQKRADEVLRTVYVGNLGPQIEAEILKQFFSACGEISFVKIAGASDNASRYAFIEFKELGHAAMAMQLTGSMLGDRQIKVGKANNPIVKPASEEPDPEENQRKIDDAMKKVREAQAKLAEKLVGDTNGKDKDRKRSSRSRDRDRRKRSRSRSRSRGRRSSDRDRHRRRSRSRERERDRGRQHRSRSKSPPIKRFNPGKKKVAPKIDTTGMFWDGFQWNPVVPAGQAPQ
jgi:RNA recognition motif-containing protein